MYVDEGSDKKNCMLSLVSSANNLDADQVGWYRYIIQYPMSLKSIPNSLYMFTGVTTK